MLQNALLIGELNCQNDCLCCITSMFMKMKIVDSLNTKCINLIWRVAVHTTRRSFCPEKRSEEKRQCPAKGEEHVLHTLTIHEASNHIHARPSTCPPLLPAQQLYSSDFSRLCTRLPKLLLHYSWRQIIWFACSHIQLLVSVHRCV
jgi:hypothetical protein